MSIDALAVRCFCPYPLDAVRTVLARAKRVVVEKAFAVGVRGIVGQNVRLALSACRSRSTTSSPGWATGRSRAHRCGGCSRTRSRGAWGG
jgi:pyruvate ferredoxin oxidoreductase alpha subunit